MVDLPDPEVAWKPTAAVGDPYIDWSLRSASGSTILLRTEQGQAVDQIEPAQYERWAFPNAALPPGVGGFRVLSRDDDTSTITLRLESNGRRTYPLRRCEVAVRDYPGFGQRVGLRTFCSATGPRWAERSLFPEHLSARGTEGALGRA